MKLNYTSLQHAVDPVEAPVGSPVRPDRAVPVLVLPLHGHLAPAAWALGQARPGARLGYVQTPGGALAGSMSRDVVAAARAGPDRRGDQRRALLRRRARGDQRHRRPACGGGGARLGRDRRPPPVPGSSAPRAATGTAASPPSTPRTQRWRSACRCCCRRAFRPAIRGSAISGLSHHTRSVLELLLAGVKVAVPEQAAALWPEPRDPASAGPIPRALAEACGDRHEPLLALADPVGYAESGCRGGRWGGTWPRTSSSSRRRWPRARRWRPCWRSRPRPSAAPVRAGGRLHRKALRSRP